MNKFKAIVFAACMLFIAGLASAQQKEAAPVSKYDAEMAKKVGADDYGMRKYVLALLKTGPKDAEVTGDARKAIFKGHFDNMNRLASEGKLAVAGPFADPDKKYRGLFILAVATVEEAKALAETDPTVKAGVLVVEYVPWYGSASLMLSNELHDKVAKKGM
ncbi:MAG TPA: YciI family protein [Pyrinomonadaceae bacterium]|nr:YciI family protein [Pyrinomonadaceae bacterium]